MPMPSAPCPYSQADVHVCTCTVCALSSHPAWVLSQAREARLGNAISTQRGGGDTAPGTARTVRPPRPMGRLVRFDEEMDGEGGPSPPRPLPPADATTVRRADETTSGEMVASREEWAASMAPSLDLLLGAQQFELFLAEEARLAEARAAAKAEAAAAAAMVAAEALVPRPSLMQPPLLTVSNASEGHTDPCWAAASRLREVITLWDTLPDVGSPTASRAPVTTPAAAPTERRLRSQCSSARTPRSPPPFATAAGLAFRSEPSPGASWIERTKFARSFTAA